MDDKRCHLELVVVEVHLEPRVLRLVIFPTAPSPSLPASAPSLHLHSLVLHLSNFNLQPLHARYGYMLKSILSCYALYIHFFMVNIRLGNE